ncbi:hypothetical protein OBBRIDRAFT_837516 [Obba rivulosa]|uniref:BRCT domain-containing protein n=1 Tax=Obba rivulosa TaxID=1052685 RepID=A0A8E2DIX4_9APHY|nr:hypothetical protein OBBRIDRAFT_837516 [Obba rivulosa]
MSSGIFDGVHYFLSATFSADERDTLTELLDEEGAIATPLDYPALTHFVCNTSPSDDTLEALPSDSPAHIVTPQWIKRSRVLGSQQPPEYYSPDPAMLFSGITATATDLSSADMELLSAAITALGGQWRSALTRDVTHLFALAPGSAKYETAMHFKDETDMRVLVPHWFDDSVRLGIRALPTDEYEWPEPRVFKFAHDPARAFAPEELDEKRRYKMTREKKALYETALASGDEMKLRRAPIRDVWQGRKILLSTTLELTESQRDAQESDILRGGGIALELDSVRSGSASEQVEEEVRKVEEADVFITRYRAGAAYAKAYRLNKTIGTLPWLWYVRSTGTLSNPLSQLLHYPLPKKPIEGFSSHVITITNYTGRDREYLKKLIIAMGAQFTPDMTGKNTAVIAAYIHGDKTAKAISWSIPIVNHTWLEDCFVQWRALTPARDKYIQFPPGVDFGAVLAERGVGRVHFDPAELEALEEEDAVEDAVLGAPARRASGGGLSRRNTANSARDAREVEDTIVLDEAGGADVSVGAHLDVDMQIDEDARVRVNAVSPSRKSAGPSVAQRMKPKSALKSPEGRRSRAEVEMPGPPGGAARVTYAQPEAGGEVAEPSRRTTRADERTGKEAERSDDDIHAPPRTRLRRQSDAAAQEARRGASSKARFPVSDSESDTAPEDDAPGSQSPRRAKAASAATAAETGAPSTPAGPAGSPRKLRPQVSVELPSLSSVYASPAKRTPARAGAPAATAVARTDSVRIAAAEAPAGSASKGARPAPSPSKRPRAASPSSSLSPPPKPARRKKAVVLLDTPSAGPSQAGDVSVVSLARTPSRREAATKATRRLRDEIMPDVVSFQRELKRGAVRAAWEGEQGRGEKAERARDVGAKGKKRASLGEDGLMSADGEEPERKKRRTGANGAGTGEGSEGERAKKKGKGREDTGRRRSALDDVPADVREDTSGKKAAKAVRVMTTQVQLSDEIVKALAKLGVKMTTKPSECTHLVAKSLVRTEKFLCAMAAAPYVVNEKWVTSSIATKQLLPEKDFALSDPENEKKFGYKLDDALGRAKANEGKLFAGMTFYVTPKVPVDAKLLKNVVAAGGGQVVTQTPTARVLNGHEGRYVISCAADASIWRPLAQQRYPIYSQELVLTGALKQEIEWDNPNHRVT